MHRAFFICLGLQALVSAGVVGVFKSIENRFQAGMVAGGLFICLGLAIVGWGIFSSKFRRSATFVLACLHLGAIAIPMVAFRVANSGVEFSELKVWGLPGPQFHRLSEMFYLIWMVTTLVEGIWRWRKARQGL